MLVEVTARGSVQWLCVLSYPLCSSAVFHSQLPDSASKASLALLADSGTGAMEKHLAREPT